GGGRAGGRGAGHEPPGPVPAHGTPRPQESLIPHAALPDPATVPAAAAGAGAGRGPALDRGLLDRPRLGAARPVRAGAAGADVVEPAAGAGAVARPVPGAGRQR